MWSPEPTNAPWASHPLTEHDFPMTITLDTGSGERYSYTEHTVGSRTVTMIEDRLNEYAWVQSSVTYPVER